MSKLIYADSLRQDILALPNCYNGFSDAYDKACIIGVIDEQQPVDAVPVVRCKDCKHRQKDTIFKKLYCDGREVVADGFCEKGERDETD